MIRGGCGSGGDRLEGGNGNDIYRVQAPMSYALGANVEPLTLTGTAVMGSGNALANVVSGNAVANGLFGGAGNDTLFGGAGGDTLNGGNGNDKLWGRLGAAGALAPGAFRAGVAAADASDRVVYDGATGSLFYDADGNGAGAAVLFATVAAGTSLTAADFFVF